MSHKLSKESPSKTRTLTPNAQQSPPHSSRRSKASVESRSSIFKRRSFLSDDTRRDSGLAQSFSTTGNENHADTSLYVPGLHSSKSMQEVPSIVVNGTDSTSGPKLRTPDHIQSPSDAQNYTSPRNLDDPHHETRPESSQIVETDWLHRITTEIPTGDFEDPFASNQYTFSKRGSVLWSGKRSTANRSGAGTPDESSRLSSDGAALVSQRSMSAEEKLQSRRLRLMYEHGDEHIAGTLEALPTSINQDDTFVTTPGGDTLSNLPSFNLSPHSNVPAAFSRSGSAMSNRRLSWIQKEPQEAAGGIEDWNDVNINEVDRYGFIRSRKSRSGTSSKVSSPVPGTPDHQRSPRAMSGLEPVEENTSYQNQGSEDFGASKRNRLSILNRSRPPSRSTQHHSKAPSIRSTRSRQSSSSFNPFRPSAPNKGRRWADAAPEMLVQQPGLPEMTSPNEASQADPAKRQLERKREAKWQSMAKAISTTPSSLAKSRTAKSPTVGGGTVYTFNVYDPKLIDRTWKGIPDRWRASAWRSFLEQSAKRLQGSNFVSDDTLIDQYLNYQSLDCPDDVQIDMDVHRTISGHIMFRRRYRGGQRLLFRVLRALALHFPQLGYVQGMAPLIATLLCYYEEEVAFTMAVRMWQCRGLEELYSPGFEGLMDVLNSFEKDWLTAHPAATQLERLGVVPTSYGTKWYLTLFNNTLPFQAQLRVWDILMLLGDGTWDSPGTRGSLQARTKFKQNKAVSNFDVLHAVAAALVDSMQEVLLDADFENAMKCLTGHVAVGKENVLMDIVRKEWKEHARRR